MKTSLKVLAFSFALALPAALVAGAVGIRLPVTLSAEGVIGAYIVAGVLLVGGSDYARSAPSMRGVAARLLRRARLPYAA